MIDRAQAAKHDDCACPPATQGYEVSCSGGIDSLAGADANISPAVVLIEGTDFESFPAGGQLTMARALMKAFGNRLALVGVNRDRGPVGRWVEREIDGTTYLFFPLASRKENSGKRPIVPARLTIYRALRRHQREILALGCRAAFIQAPEALLAVSNWPWDSLCFWFAGVASTLKVSRYSFAKPLSGLFDRALFSALDRVNTVLAAADEDSITSLVHRSRGRLSRERIVQVPTCVDTSFFQPSPASAARAKLGVLPNFPMFVTVGRIGRFKGWELLLEAFQSFLANYPEALLVFVGDGEDRAPLQSQIQALNLERNVIIAGFQCPEMVKRYLNAADAVLSGSFQEGWSVAMLEALACGKAIVSTEVSGVRAMILSGQNGFVIKDRSALEFARAMEQVLSLTNVTEISTSIASRFDLAHMADTLSLLWPPFRRKVQMSERSLYRQLERDLPTAQATVHNLPGVER